MKKKNYHQTIRSFLLLLLLVVCSSPTKAQKATVRGQVISKDKLPLIGATISLPEQSLTGTTTDENGYYSLEIPPGIVDLEASYVGYEARRKNSIVLLKDTTLTIDFILVEDFLEAVVVIGSVGDKGRIGTDAPAPVDLFKLDELKTSAPQISLNQLLHHMAPSFTSNTQMISDGTDHIDPASLRGLGPDQVLVLLNKKRRHTTSLVNVNGTFGRGNVGTDLNALPMAAIESIEILRDGAAAQYGSDAIAGVINLKMREATDELQVMVHTGGNFTRAASPEKNVDGETVELSANYGMPLGAEDRGFLNLTGALEFRGWTNRMQEFGGDIFNRFNAIERAVLEGDSGLQMEDMNLSNIQDFSEQVLHFSPETKALLTSAPTMDSLYNLLAMDATDEELAARGQSREDYNMRVGQSALRGGKFFGNFLLPLNDEVELYSFGGISFREGRSDCFQRLPNEARTYTPLYPNGFTPSLRSQIGDKSFAFGLRGKVADWDADLSNTFGKNDFTFLVDETANATLEGGSPNSFNSGGHSFQQNTGNLNLSRFFEMGQMEGVTVEFGMEYRFERYQINAGSEESYGNYDIDGELVNANTADGELVHDPLNRTRPQGAQCFAGFLPQNSVDARRSSMSLFSGADWEFSPDWLLSTAVRFENYSDFGSTFNYKLASRYKLSTGFAIRAAHSTGFRAPSLHQINFSRTRTIFTTQGGRTVAEEEGVFSNTSTAARLLGIPSLKQERSRNYSLGFSSTVKELSLKLTVDAYWINIRDRVVLTGSFAPGADPALQEIFSDFGATRATFFANAIDTKSSGLDIVATHRWRLDDNRIITTDLAATFSRTRAVRGENGDVKVNSSETLSEANLDSVFFDVTSRQYLEKAVPRTKITLGNSVEMKNFTFYVRNTFFGSTEEATNIEDPNTPEDYSYSGRLITDMSLTYKPNRMWNITVGANNLFDIYPEESDPAFQSGGRFIYSRRSPQFNYGGRHLFARLLVLLDNKSQLRRSDNY
ncbi:MAG: TonB-dependent receptor [Bacteroidota bacterium]